MSIFPCRFCLITDFSLIMDNKVEYIIKNAIQGGVDLIQYRDKESAKELQMKRAAVLKKMTVKNNIKLIINGSIDLALAVNADGVHLGQGGLSARKARELLGPDKLIGVSVHNSYEILEINKRVTDYMILSPIFQARSKKKSLPPLGQERFSGLCKITELPVLGLGGINEENAHIPIQEGACGVACITGLLRAENIYKTARMIREALERYLI